MNAPPLVLGLLGSPRRNGNRALLRQTALAQGRRLPDVARAVLEHEALLPGAAAAG